MDFRPVRVIITGGTFDKHYDEIKGELGFNGSHIPEILERARVTLPTALEVNQLIDSLHMQDVNRKGVLEACRLSPEDAIVVTHGTDTMQRTAEVIGKASLPKTVVITGAMVPYQVLDSDALFNFGGAFLAAQLLPHGVYVVMNGRAFAWDHVRKNREKGVFEEV